MASKGILIFAIHNNRSAEGVSHVTQILYALVFCTRYLDLFSTAIVWNVIFKTTYLLTSFYILGIMQWVFPRSRERELSWKLGAIIVGGAAALSPFAMLALTPKVKWSFLGWMWSFSEILESVCILPQLLLLRQTNVPTVIDSFYLLALGSYRALYCVNWFWRILFDDRKPDTLAVIFGLIQTALYVDFAWVYYTRQRVKLRGGGVVDADDMRNGWLVQRIFGRTLGQHNEEHDEEAGLQNDEQRGSRPKWGSRGISVSADEGVFADEEHGEESRDLDDTVDPDAKMQDPDDLAKALDDDDEGEDAPLRGQSSSQGASGIRSGEEWRD
ncbi:hypothetical protein LLEC1_07328 [Akanthomyces lecanii]|uniref:ER lumen protein-retaining receptor n=1 Tax=Cordyceps confragosa TaxID=2714763 RepID=A0A179IM06_CORDF|nr:hypothetical protein LLEC1_07328 [Akanthomyces lecanii]